MKTIYKCTPIDAKIVTVDSIFEDMRRILQVDAKIETIQKGLFKKSVVVDAFTVSLCQYMDSRLTSLCWRYLSGPRKGKWIVHQSRLNDEMDNVVKDSLSYILEKLEKESKQRLDEIKLAQDQRLADSVANEISEATQVQKITI